MKTITFLLTAMLLFSGCSQNIQKKVEKSVKNYLTENLKNPKTYGLIGFSKVDTITQADTINDYLKMINYLIDLEKESQKRIERQIEIRFDIDKPSEKPDKYLKKGNSTIDSLEKVINSLNELAKKPEVKNNLIRYKVTHEYSHKSLDNELVNLKLDFFLDKTFKVLPSRILKGINGKANFEIKILCRDGGFYYTEFVVDPKLDGQLINSDGTTELTLKAGKHYLTWTASNKNGFGILTSPETFRKELLLEDTNFTETYFIIYGKTFYSYKNEKEAINDKFYNDYLKKK